MKTVNLKRARIIEIGTPDQNGILIRTRLGGLFTRIGGVEKGRPHCTGGPQFSEQEVSRNANITVLAEFPLTLADLIPEGCTRFKFHNDADYPRLAHRIEQSNPVWEVTGMHGEWSDLNELAVDCGVDLTTVIPLQVHSQYVEERR